MELVLLVCMLLALPVAAVGVLMMLMITGVIREKDETELAADAYRQSWDSAER